MTIGITIGKFYPLHTGHELMIEMAASQLDELIVIVSSDDNCKSTEHTHRVADLSTRYNIIKEKYAGRNITVVKHVDIIGPPKHVDKHGTATDERFWGYWINVFHILGADATHFVSSDRYGAEAAKRLNIDWFAVDPDRELVDISATRIRENPIKEWKYIAKEFRPFFVKRVVVIGPESCGKSTLVNDLGHAWGSPAVPEYGRIMAEIVGDGFWTVKNFHDIVHRQQAMNEIAAMQSENGIIFIDTEAYTTYLYCMEYINARSNTIFRKHQLEHFDLIVLVKPNIPWIDDGGRIQKDQADRVAFYDALYARFTPKIRVIQLDETDRHKRVDIISEHIINTVLQVSDPVKHDVFNLTPLDISRNIIE